VPKRLPRDVIASWPEIFGKVEINAIPTEYLQSIIVSFKNGDRWDIEMNSKELVSEDITVEQIIEDLLEEYEDDISAVDFRVHTARVKRDMIKTTRKFMKGKFKKK
jgi:hypothetical protein|tara:strand:- start:1355 stop:1672 length:318 start_codon:yes stop_codon:yes gene_type:complete